MSDNVGDWEFTSLFRGLSIRCCRCWDEFAVLCRSEPRKNINKVLKQHRKECRSWR